MRSQLKIFTRTQSCAKGAAFYVKAIGLYRLV